MTTKSGQHEGGIALEHTAKAVQHHGFALEHASEEMTTQPDQNGFALEHASHEMTTTAGQQDGFALEHASQEMTTQAVQNGADKTIVFTSTPPSAHIPAADDDVTQCSPPIPAAGDDATKLRRSAGEVAPSCIQPATVLHSSSANCPDTRPPVSSPPNDEFDPWSEIIGPAAVLHDERLTDEELLSAQCRCAEAMGIKLDEDDVAALREEIQHMGEDERKEFSAGYKKFCNRGGLDC
jgi:hypothetical protein